MNCIMIGAGNAGRPAARIFNYIGHNVKITDQKKLDEFPENVQKALLQMKKEGITLNLGSENPKEFKNIDSVYISPTIPEKASIMQILDEKGVKLISNREISQIVDELIDIDIIGVTGTLGKTSTTHIIAQIFESGGYRVWKCSSRHGNLLSEVIVEGIIQNQHRTHDIAVFEIPHGTSRLLSEVKLEVGVLTNLYPEHLDEFDHSMEKYVQRKLFIADSSEILISTPQCKDYLKPFRDDVVFYCTQNQECNVRGRLKDNQIYIEYDLSKYDLSSPIPRKGYFKTDFRLLGYYFENSIAAATAALCYGLNENMVKKGLSAFKGISGHMEYMGKYCGREVHFDAAFVPEGLVATLDQFLGHNLVILVDNPDTTTMRDKSEIGKVLGEYADVIISSGYNETLKVLDMDAAQKVLKGAADAACLKIPVENMIMAGELSIKNSRPGDTIIHVGPGAITNYDDLKEKMMLGIEQGCKRYG